MTTSPADDDTIETLGTSVRQMQIITMGLTASPIIFSFFAYLVPIFEIEGEAAQLLTGIGLVIGLVVLVIFRPLGRFIARQSSNPIDLERALDNPASLAGALHSGMFIICSICNGSAFVNLLAYWVTRSPMNLAMAVMLIASATTQIPRIDIVQDWVDSETKKRRDSV